jgi:hypothetical protein
MATTITPTIVTVNVTVTEAPEPSQLQQSGAAVSTGGTTLAADSYQYCGSLAAVQAILAAPVGLTSLSWAGGVVTATASSALSFATGQVFTTTISGAVPAAYNGTFTATVTGTDTFTYALATSPGTETTSGAYLPGNAGFLSNAATTFFAQGNSVGMYVLELGPQSTATEAITALQTWITGNSAPQVFYAYLVPAAWDFSSAADLNTLANNYSSPTGKTYFFVTTTAANISSYTNKAVFATVPSPTQASTEHQASVLFYNWLANTPSAAAPVPPMGYRAAYGVTPWAQTTTNNVSINAVLSAYGNLILTGAEGGLPTNAYLFKGTTMDGNQGMFWYAIDWLQIQIKLMLANAVLNGSNSNPPLYYNQNGINTLLAVAQDQCTAGISFGLLLNATVTAQSFASYTAANPANYKAGLYGGLSCTATPQLGFLSITFNLDATSFA